MIHQTLEIFYLYLFAGNRQHHNRDTLLGHEMEEILPPVLCLREQQPLLRTIAKTLAHGAADAKHAPHVDEVFQTLIGGAYIGYEGRYSLYGAATWNVCT